MRYRIEKRKEGLDVDVGVTGEARERVLAAFQACQEGRCACPTQEYEKIESLEIQRGEAGIRLRLHSKPGQAIDAEQVEACLAHTQRSLPADD